MSRQILKSAEMNATNFSSNAGILVNFLSYIGVPDMDPVDSKKFFNKLRKMFQYFVVIYLFCVTMVSTPFRFEVLLMTRRNVFSIVTVLALVMSFLLLKLVLLLKLRKLKAAVHSLCGSALHRELKSHFCSRNLIIVGCIGSLLIPIPLSLYNEFYEARQKMYDWIYISRSPEASTIIVFLIDIGYSINEFSFPLILTTLLSYAYVAFSRLLLNAFSEQLKAANRNPTSSNIKSSLAMYWQVRRTWMQVEDATSIIAFLLYGLSFSMSLYLVHKYFSVECESLTTISKVKALVCATQVIMLSVSGSVAVEKWKEIRLLVEEMMSLRSMRYHAVQNRDILLLMALVEGTKMDLSFTCFGLLTLGWELLLKTAVAMVTFGALLL